MTDPLDETQPHDTSAADRPLVPGPGETVPASAIGGGTTGGGNPPRTGGTPPLRADPSRPTTDWREPPWLPPRHRDRDRGPSLAAIIVGLVLLGIGGWYFLDRTLGIDLPELRWSNLWPLILVVVGAVIVLNALRDRR